MNAGPLPVQTGAGRIAGIDLNKPRIRAAPSAALALAPASGGFTAVGFTAKVGNLTPARRLRHSAGRLRPQEIPRQGPRGQAWPTGGYHVAPGAARTIAALLALRDHVIAPILAGSVAPPRLQAQDLDLVDRDYEILRIAMQALFRHVGIATRPAAA